MTGSLSLRRRHFADPAPISSSPLTSSCPYSLVRSPTAAWSSGLGANSVCAGLRYWHRYYHARGSTFHALDYLSHWSKEFPYEHRQTGPQHWHPSEQTARDGCSEADTIVEHIELKIVGKTYKCILIFLSVVGGRLGGCMVTGMVLLRLLLLLLCVLNDFNPSLFLTGIPW